MPTNVTWNGVSYAIPNAGELNWASLTNFLVALGTYAAVDEEAKQTIRVATTSPVSVVAGTDYAVVVDLSVAGASTVNLPAGVDGQIFIIVDGKGDAGTNNITINPNGAETIGGSASVVMNKNRQVVMVQYHVGTTDWKLTNYSIPIGGVTPGDLTGVVPSSKGGTGVSNNDAATLTRVGNFDVSLTATAATSVTLPTTGTLATLAGSENLTNKNLASSTNTLTGATAGSFTNTGTITLPTATTTLVGTDTTDVLTNKTLQQDLIDDYIDVNEESAPATPASGKVRMYAKADGLLYSKDDAGVETQLGGTSSSSSASNMLLNSAFLFSQRFNGTTIANGVTSYCADRWYSVNGLGSGGILQLGLGGGTFSGSPRSMDVEVSTAPGSPSSNGANLYQVLPNSSSVVFYNQDASFSAYLTAVGNVNEIGLQFMYATSETALASTIGSEVLVAVNNGGPTLGSIVNQAMGTGMGASGVVGIRIRVTDVSSGNISDVGNGLIVELAMMVVGNLPATWAPAFADEGAELDACRRYLETSYSPLNTAPGSTVTNSGYFSPSLDNGANVFAPVKMVQKRDIPSSVHVYAPDGTLDEVKHYKAGGTAPNQAVSIQKVTENSFVLNSPNSGSFMEFDFIADAEIY